MAPGVGFVRNPVARRGADRLNLSVDKLVGFHPLFPTHFLFNLWTIFTGPLEPARFLITYYLSPGEKYVET